jgi:ribosomal protein L15E
VDDDWLEGHVSGIYTVESKVASEVRVGSGNARSLKPNEGKSPSSQGLAKSSMKAQLKRFVEIMRKICANLPFVEANILS